MNHGPTKQHVRRIVPVRGCVLARCGLVEGTGGVFLDCLGRSQVSQNPAVHARAMPSFVWLVYWADVVAQPRCRIS